MKRFISRKFLLAVCGVIYGIYINSPEVVYTSILAFIGVEGLADTAERYRAPRTISEGQTLIDDEADRTTIVTGVGTLRPSDSVEE